jgi:hypothetical protein
MSIPRLLLPAPDPIFTQIPMPTPLTTSERALAERLIAAQARAARFEEALRWLAMLNRSSGNFLDSQLRRAIVADLLDETTA